MLRADSASDAKRSCELCFSVLVKRSVLTAHPNPYLLEVLPEVQDVCVCVCVHVFVFFCRLLQMYFVTSYTIVIVHSSGCVPGKVWKHVFGVASGTGVLRSAPNRA